MNRFVFRNSFSRTHLLALLVLWPCVCGCNLLWPKQPTSPFDSDLSIEDIEIPPKLEDYDNNADSPDSSEIEILAVGEDGFPTRQSGGKKQLGDWLFFANPKSQEINRNLGH